MKAYYFGNRRRLRCLYGAPGDPYEYIPNSISRPTTGKETRPLWRYGPAGTSVSAGQAVGAIRHETIGSPVTVELPFGRTELASGVLRATRSNQSFDLVGISSSVLEIARGRDRPVAVADCYLAHSPETSLIGSPQAEPFGDAFQVTPLSLAGGIVAFLEKTAAGYGSRFVRITLRRLEHIEPTIGLSLEGSDSRMDDILSLLTVSLVDGGSESVLHRSLVGFFHKDDAFEVVSTNAGASLRVALGCDSESQSHLCLSMTRQLNDNGWYFFGRMLPGNISHTACIPYAPPSDDATVFGAIRKPADAPEVNYYSSSVNTAYAGVVAGKGLPICEVSHDSLADAAFVAGCTARPDADTAFTFSSRRSSWEPSELANRIVTTDVRCGSSEGKDVPSVDGESSTLTPVVEFASVRSPYLAEMYAGSRTPLVSKCIASAAHALDRSALSAHSASFQSFPNDGYMHFMGKRFSSAKVTIVGRGSGVVPGKGNVALGNGLGIFVPEDTDFDLQTMLGWVQGFFQPALNDGYQYPGPLHALPLGEFECESQTINGVPMAPGVMRCTATQIDQGFSTTLNTGMTFATHWKSRAEVVAVFGVGLQEPGQYSPSAGDPESVSNNPSVSDTAYARLAFPSPLAPAGRIVDRAFVTPQENPSPVLTMRLLARTVTKCESSAAYDPLLSRSRFAWSTTTASGGRSNYFLFVRGGLTDLGTFVFNRQQTESLMNGGEVRASTWYAATGENPEKGDTGFLQYDNLYFPLSLWIAEIETSSLTLGPGARFWLNFKVRLNIEG